MSTCPYCYNTNKIGNRIRVKELMGNLPIINDLTNEPIPIDENPQQYIQKYRNKYSLVTQFGDYENEKGILCQIFFCPICGRNLHEKELNYP